MDSGHAIPERVTWSRPGKNEVTFSGKAINGYINRYGTKGIKLGAGSFGSVYKIKIKDHGGGYHPFAIKQTKFINNASSRNMELELAEDANKGQDLDHPNVYTFYGAVLFDNFLTIIMELCDGSILDLTRRLKRNPADLDPHRTDVERRNGAMPEALVSRVFASVACGLIYLYKKLIYHSDIKVENILYRCKTGEFKLADFGISSNRTASMVSGVALTTACTINVPPETLGGNMTLNQALDIWALGILISHFALGKHPVQRSLEEQGIDNINQAHYVQELKGKVGKGQLHTSGYPLPPQVYSVPLMRIYNDMTAVNPNHRSRYLTKKSSDKFKNDGLRQHTYKGPDEGIIDSEVYNEYSNDAMKDVNSWVYYDVMTQLYASLEPKGRPSLREPSHPRRVRKFAESGAAVASVRPSPGLPIREQRSNMDEDTAGLVSSMNKVNIGANPRLPSKPVLDLHTASNAALKSEVIRLRQRVSELEREVNVLKGSQSGQY